jgi:hypothetical protein
MHANVFNNRSIEIKQNNISSKIQWLRISYWTGAIADLAVEIYAIVQNIAPMLNLGLLLGSQTALLILFAFSYINSRGVE